MPASREENKMPDSWRQITRKYASAIGLAIIPPGITYALATTGAIDIGSFDAGWLWVFYMLVGAPLIEEFAFRGVVQPLMHHSLPKALHLKGPISTANVLASLVFATLHLSDHRPIVAASIFFPSLVFGYLKDAYGGLVLPITMHAWYNAVFLLIIVSRSF